jgi:hypothetical protein
VNYAEFSDDDFRDIWETFVEETDTRARLRPEVSRCEGLGHDYAIYFICQKCGEVHEG